MSTASTIEPATKRSGLTNLTVHIVHEGGSLPPSPIVSGSETGVAPRRRPRVAGGLPRARRAGRAPAVLRHRLRHTHVDPHPAPGDAIPADGSDHAARRALRHHPAHPPGHRHFALAAPAPVGGGPAPPHCRPRP